MITNINIHASKIFDIRDHIRKLIIYGIDHNLISIKIRYAVSIQVSEEKRRNATE